MAWVYLSAYPAYFEVPGRGWVISTGCKFGFAWRSPWIPYGLEMY